MGMISFDEIAELKIKMQAVVFSIEDGIVMTDFEGNIQVINDSAKKMLGIEKGYPYEKRFLDYVPNPWIKTKLDDLFKSREISAQIEVAVPNEKKETYFHLKKNLVTTAQGVVLGQVVVIHDITAEKELEKMKDDFVHSITHDLKSPLTSLQGFIKIFMEGGLGAVSAEQKHYLEVMDHSANGLLKMINNILDLAKFEADRMAVEKGKWNAVDAVRRIVDSYQGVAQKKHVRFSVNCAPKPVTIVADGRLLERALTNLIDNALKFTSEGGEVGVDVQDFPDSVKFSVRDTGAGIPADSMDKIFQKFHQLPGTQGGTGLGLTIVKHIVEVHDGKIEVTSQPGLGSTFLFTIPKKN